MVVIGIRWIGLCFVNMCWVVCIFWVFVIKGIFCSNWIEEICGIW